MLLKFVAPQEILMTRNLILPDMKSASPPSKSIEPKVLRLEFAFHNPQPVFDQGWSWFEARAKVLDYFCKLPLEDPMSAETASGCLWAFTHLLFKALVASTDSLDFIKKATEYAVCRSTKVYLHTATRVPSDPIQSNTKSNHFGLSALWKSVTFTFDHVANDS